MDGGGAGHGEPQVLHLGMVLIAQAFLSIVVIIRLSNIVIRRMYLAWMAAAIDPEGPTDMAQDQRVFWQCMAGEMVANSQTLLAHVETFFSTRSPQLGFPPIQVFGVFMCGNVFSYLCKWPERE
jgi:hypothetical protein